MAIQKILHAVLALGAIAPLGMAQQPATVNDAVEKIVAQEQVEIQNIRKYSPLVETYIQLVRPDKALGAVPDGDRYFLGRAELAKGVELEPLVSGTGKHKFLSAIGNFFRPEFLPRGFLQMIYLDTEGFDQRHYRFTYEGREFLGEVRCLVFDVDPLPNAGKGRFVGRIWAEDQDYHIVRFNGSYGDGSKKGYYFDFDSWRVNAGANEWLPAYIYSEEGNVQYGISDHSPFPPFKAQTRLWGYSLSRPMEEQMLSSVTVEGTDIKDQTLAGNGYTPLQARRAWGRMAEDNVAAKLQSIGLLAPRGEVDKVLDTVVNNLEVTNNLDIQPEVRCRVLVTTTLESFTMGHTIVLSRGLIDVLPDEQSLAAVLAHELGHVMLGHRLDSEFAFFNHMRFDEKDTFHHFEFARSPQEEAAANKIAVELLKKSPYRDESGSSQTFFLALQSRAKQIPNLVSPHLGDSVQQEWSQVHGAATQQMVTKAAADTVIALPLGGRIKVEPWSDELTLLKPKPESGTVAEYEKMPFEVAPFLVYLTRQGNSHAENGARAVTVNAQASADHP
ncbi:MAG TPA: M48 family metalloprotease [Terriglobales bacterium]|nr:M48 family metalloprotease [Terriglobales bacterium]